MNSLSDITVLALDVDGVLTDGTISFDPVTQKEMKTFHVKDGLGISLWLKSGFEVVLISGRTAQCVTIRAEELGITHVVQGSKDKIKDLNSILSKIGATPEQTVFVGDDLGDIAIMQHVGCAIAVQDAAPEVKDISHWITPRNGGQGAVRDAIEYLMKETYTWQDAITSINISTAQQ